MGLLDKINKRNCYPVELSDRKVFVRSMTFREIRRTKGLPEELQTPFVLGVSLVSEAGVREIPQNTDENDEEYAKRVDDALADAEVDSQVMAQIVKAISKIGNVDVEAIAKN